MDFVVFGGRYHDHAGTNSALVDLVCTFSCSTTEDDADDSFVLESKLVVPGMDLES